jgi:hypothetical protein
MSNLSAESRVLIIDKTKGLLAGAAIERHAKEVLHVELSGQ